MNRFRGKPIAGAFLSADGTGACANATPGALRYNARRPMAKFTHHIFVCCNQREPGHSRGCCDPAGNEALKACFKAEVERRGLKPLVRANSAGCLDQCERGPTVVIYPQAIWYGGVTPADVPRIVEDTIVGGRVIEELRIPDAALNCRSQGKG